ncbi:MULTISPECIES: gephyrin-like molybdotransferase Glp [Halocynthiibacter]|uniref:Molybdopterin molybdenumtransferase n=1 Tax=Halocynthiibacter halioticoli TaxID=2986804 RepID=A0AAE3LUH3_9RHOB|nr:MULTISPECIES: gephyrin-like molybdotransferase Glp [Halocynthiibacter]MCV6824175.1 molybdopterin molybdotransferase MoeA [Halocynthiibacter halioticoli]MCW4057176.1 molybdopterin molybdotransferase MoeA [Halocynthiibacter sp. SDUM655004]
MISVDEALAKTLALATPTGTENVPLAEAAGLMLAEDIVATRNQPPFASSAMDGYAVKAVEVEPHAMFSVIGESAAGHGFDGKVGAGQAVRIFTGAPVPEGADRVVIQEDVTRRGNLITLETELDSATYIRPLGDDFSVGDRITAPRVLSAGDIALAASMNTPEVTVAKRPEVALIATGDELVMPGEAPGPDQIIASNSFGLKAMLESAGAHVRMLPIARDTRASLNQTFDLAEGADLIVTIGGASVGDHDLVGDVTEERGMERSFYKIAMRPGKPLMAGRVGNAAMIGLPGNPVSSMVCGQIFILPMIRMMLGHPTPLTTPKRAKTTVAMPANGPRAHYMRAVLTTDDSGNTVITPLMRQDSGLLTVLSEANALLIRPAHAEAIEAGTQVSYLDI